LEVLVDHVMRRLTTDGTDAVESTEPTISRRILLGWAGRGLNAAAGLALFGPAATTSAADAKESSDGDGKQKDSKEKSTQSTESKSRRKKKGKKKKGTTQTSDSSSSVSRFIVPGQDRYNCTDFTSQAEAQAVLRRAPEDPNNLDRNRNGIACEGVEASQDGVPGGFMMPPYDVNPVPRR
jgi:hypothetical protein